MNRPQALAALRTLLPSIVESGDPSGVLTKAADDRGWSPEQLQHVGQLFNTAKAVTYMDKVAMSLRGAQHTILDVPKMVSDFARLPVKSAAPVVVEHSEWFESAEPMDKLASEKALKDSDWFEDDAEKSANLRRLPNFMSDITQDDVLQKSASFDAPAYTDGAAISHTAVMDEQHIKEAAAHEAQMLEDFTWDTLEKLNNDLTKFANSPLAAVADEVEYDMYGELGVEKVACVLRALGPFCDTTGRQLKRASVQPGGFSYDRHNAREAYEAIWNSASLLETAHQIKSAAETVYSSAEERERKQDGRPSMIPKALEQFPPGKTKQREGKKPTEKGKPKSEETATPEGKDPSTAASGGKDGKDGKDGKKGKKGKNGKDKPVTTSDTLTAAADTFSAGAEGLGKMVSGTRDNLQGHTTSVQGVADALKPDTNEHQIAVDSGAQEAAQEATLKQLLATDDVIKTADPQVVERLYTALVTEEPALATNPEALSIALREAIQYNGVPMHTMSELGKHRKTRLESERLETDQARQRYAN